MKIYRSSENKKIVFFLTSILLLISAILSCKKQDNLIEFTTFPAEYNLIGKKLNFPIQTPSLRMRLFDSLLIFRSTYDSMYFMHIYNKNTFQNYRSFFRRGNGPNEYKSAGTFSLDKKLRLLWITDFSKIRIVGYYIILIAYWNFLTANLHLQFHYPVNCIL